MYKVINLLFTFLTQIIVFPGLSFSQKILIITTVEYLDLIDGGASAMHITSNDGTEEHIPLRGLYSFGGFISEKKIKDNDQTIIGKLSYYLENGWNLLEVTSATQPKTDTSKPPCIITRYIMLKKN